MLQTSSSKNELSGAIGKFKFAKAEHFPDCSEYHFNVNNYYVMASLLSRSPEGDFVDCKGYNKDSIFEVYQFQDASVQLLKDNSETLLSIFNRDFEKRKQVLKVLEEVFV